MIVSFNIPAPQFSLWSEDAADGLIGESFRAKVGNQMVGIGKILSTEISEDSLFLNVVAEWPDDPISKKILSVSFPDFKIITIEQT